MLIAGVQTNSWHVYSKLQLFSGNPDKCSFNPWKEIIYHQLDASIGRCIQRNIVYYSILTLRCFLDPPFPSKVLRFRLVPHQNSKILEGHFTNQTGSPGPLFFSFFKQNKTLARWITPQLDLATSITLPILLTIKVLLIPHPGIYSCPPFKMVKNFIFCLFLLPYFFS